MPHLRFHKTPISVSTKPAAAQPPQFKIGGFSFFKNGVLQFYWRDPAETDVPNPLEPINVRPEDWAYYYAPALQLVRSNPTVFAQMRRQPTLLHLDYADVRIGIHPSVLNYLEDGHWDQAREQKMPTEVLDGYPWRYKPDGIAVVAGESWLRPFEAPQ
jgi:hypothetical protein